MSEFAAFHDELRAVAKDVLGTTEPGGQVAEPPELDWQVVVDAGWAGLEVPEALDGAGRDLRRGRGRPRGAGPRRGAEPLPGDGRARCGRARAAPAVGGA